MPFAVRRRWRARGRIRSSLRSRRARRARGRDARRGSRAAVGPARPRLREGRRAAGGGGLGARRSGLGLGVGRGRDRAGGGNRAPTAGARRRVGALRTSRWRSSPAPRSPISRRATAALGRGASARAGRSRARADAARRRGDLPPRGRGRGGRRGERHDAETEAGAPVARGARGRCRRSSPATSPLRAARRPALSNAGRSLRRPGGRGRNVARDDPRSRGDAGACRARPARAHGLGRGLHDRGAARRRHALDRDRRGPARRPDRRRRVAIPTSCASGAEPFPSPGTPLEVRVPLARGIVLPQDALQLIEGDWGVFVREGDEACFARVRRGAESGRRRAGARGLSRRARRSRRPAPTCCKPLWMKRMGGGDAHAH